MRPPVTIFPPSVRRALAASATAPQTAALSFTLPYRPATAFQYRRYSSSKPSSPDDGPRDIAARQAVPSSGRSKGEKKQQQPKQVMPQPPSVPSTRHIGDEGLALSTFFALHRPISVTQLLPRTVSDDTFAQIFAPPKSRSNRVAEVLSTLQQTVQDLEEPLSRMNSIANTEQQQAQHHDVVDEHSTKISLKHPDGTETNVYLQLNSIMSGEYLPFHPPPPPEPVAEPEPEPEPEQSTDVEAASESAKEVAEREPRTRVYKAMVTIEETVDSNGEYKVVAHSPELIEEGDEPSRPRTFLERLFERQLRYDEYRRQQGHTMQAISVRRQRKLKMKKKKYKKLMKRTRNLRRKLDRL